MSKSDFRKYLDSTGELPADVLLGRIVMYTITDEMIKREDLVKWFDELYLNSAYLPPEVKAFDAYRKATAQAEGIEYTLKNGNTASTLCRDVSNTNEFVARQIVREVKDSRKRRLAYGAVIDAYFYRATPLTSGGKRVPGSERMRLTILNDSLYKEERERMQVVIDKIRDSYDRYYHYLDGQKLRGVVREYLKYLNGLELKGGVYFVHANRTDELFRLRDLITKFGGGCFMQTIPIVDLQSEREFIIDAFQREAEEKLQNIVVEIARLRANRKTITAKAYANLKADYDTIVNQATEYTRTLRVSQDRTGAAMELALDSLIDLQSQMLKQPGGTS